VQLFPSGFNRQNPRDPKFTEEPFVRGILRKSIFAIVGAEMLATRSRTIAEKMRNVPRCNASMMVGS